MCRVDTAGMTAGVSCKDVQDWPLDVCRISCRDVQDWEVSVFNMHVEG